MSAQNNGWFVGYLGGGGLWLNFLPQLLNFIFDFMVFLFRFGVLFNLHLYVIYFVPGENPYSRLVKFSYPHAYNNTVHCNIYV